MRLKILRPFAIILPFALILGCGTGAKDFGETADAITRSEMQSTLQFLSHDLLEGRSPGSRGGDLAEEYIQSIFKLIGLEEYEGSYFQPFALHATTMDELKISVEENEVSFGLDAVGSLLRDQNSFDLEGELVFCGFGIVSEDEAWDDYKGLALEGKIALIRYNEPQEDSTLFEGGYLTYFGRWTYKIEEAARHGARGVLLIHTPESAGFGWTVVRNSWGVEKLYLESSFDTSLEFYGWITESALLKVLELQADELDRLYHASDSSDFEPVSLKRMVRIRGRSRHRSVEARNVVGVIPGSDPVLGKKAIVLSAHIDHIGVSPDRSPDPIYNGAIDNASAVAAMICTGKVLMDCRDRLKHSVILLACQAEESWLLGSKAFADRLDPDKIVANINFESTPVWEASRDFFAVGARYSTLEDAIQVVLKKEGLAYSEFSMKEQGFFYRSDQFSFARRGIPSVWISAGEDFVGGKNHIQDFFAHTYHTPEDEYDPDWSLESMKQTVKIAALLVETLSNHPKPEWKGKRPFPVER